MKPTLYLETTIPSYLVSRPSRDIIIAANQQTTKNWWDRRRGEFDLYISQFVLQEAEAGDASAARERVRLLKGLPTLRTTVEVGRFATEIMESGILPKKASLDAMHIAIAALSGMDYLMTWNCVHIANAMNLKRIDSLCRDRGIECPVICTPAELLGD